MPWEEWCQRTAAFSEQLCQRALQAEQQSMALEGPDGALHLQRLAEAVVSGLALTTVAHYCSPLL